jgi:DNA (cytosine-5)-methyltransferase 1
MNELALFAGAGGGILGARLLGWRTICAVEINNYARRVLLARQEDGILQPFPIWDDVRTFDGHQWRGVVDVVSGGFPCQDISCAGKGAGITGERSGLWVEFARIVSEVRPRYVLVENSPMLVARGLGRILGDLATLGYNARWGVLGAYHAGAPHRRERIWIVAHSKRYAEREESRCWPSRRMGRIVKPIPWNEPRESALSLLRGMDDGLASVVDRTDAIRNGQVPAVVCLAWDYLVGIPGGLHR